VRRLGEADFRFVPGTENGRFPEFSPDGEWLVFRDEQEGTLVRAAVSGAGALTLVDQEGVRPFYPHWGEDGTIVFVTPTGYYYLPPGGGDPIEVPGGRFGGRLPFALPDGSGFVVGGGESGIWFVDFAGDTSWQVLPEGRHPTYVAPGFLLYVAESGDLFAAPFDLGRREVTGPSLRVLDRVRSNVGRAGYSVSRNGTLVHYEGDARSGAQSTLTLIVDPRGQVDTLRLPAENRRVSRFSPDGRRIAYEQETQSGHDLYAFDLVTGSSQQLTFEGDNDDPVWSPDGSQILFTSARRGSDGDDLMIKPADNSAPEAYVFTRPEHQIAVAWPRDDQIVFRSIESGNWDLYTYSLTDSGEPQPYLEAPWNEFDFALSPDGSLAAVETAEVSPREIWLRDFPEPIGKWRVSFGGGRDPHWSPDGRTLYYSWGTGGVDSIFAVPVDRDAGVVVRDRRVVWAGDLVRWDLHPDGERVLVVLPEGSAEDDGGPTDRYLVVLNWFEELEERMGR
jgi:Tol biopolymer transport system component